MHLPFVAPLFTLRGIEDWAAIYKPSQIEMNDRQYAHFANLNGMNLKTFKSIPIAFTDARIPRI
jgi:hypothetical protein